MSLGPAGEGGEGGGRCDEIAARLVSGDKPGEDPVLAEHVGSCLRCFRVAGDLRDLGKLEGLLREAFPDAEVDPGEAFWAKFPGTVTAAWQPQPTPVAVAPRRRLRDWLRLPIPAALAGAAVAGALVFAFYGHKPEAPVATVPPAAPAPAARVEAPAAALATDVGDEEEASFEDDVLESLDEADLDGLLARMRAGTASATPAGEETTESSVTTIEEIEALDTEDLMALSAQLRRQRRI